MTSARYQHFRSDRSVHPEPPPQILGCPAHDAADELALLMLQQLLDPERYHMAIISAEMLTGEVLSVWSSTTRGWSAWRRYPQVPWRRSATSASG